MLYEVIIRELEKLDDIVRISVTGLDYYATSEPIIIISVHTQNKHTINLSDGNILIVQDSLCSSHIQVKLSELSGFTGLISLHNWIYKRLPNLTHEIISNAIRYQYS